MLRHCWEPAGKGSPPIRNRDRAGLFPKLAGVRRSSSPVLGVACARVFALLSGSLHPASHKLVSVAFPDQSQ